MQDRPVPKGWQLMPDETLANGDMYLKLGGMEISDKLRSGLDKKAELPGQNSEEINENLDYVQFDVSPNQDLEKDEQLQSDDQHTEDSSSVTAGETSSIPALEGFEPVETEDGPSESDDQHKEDSSGVTAGETSSIPVLEGFEPVETEDGPSESDDQNKEDSSGVTSGETSSIPVLEGFEPVETEDGPSESDDQNKEDSSGVISGETSSIPVLEGFEPVETEDGPSQSDDQNTQKPRVSDANEIETTEPESSLQRAKVVKRPCFYTESSEEVDLEDEISSLPVLEGFEPIEGDE